MTIGEATTLAISAHGAVLLVAPQLISSMQIERSCSINYLKNFDS